MRNGGRSSLQKNDWLASKHGSIGNAAFEPTYQLMRLGQYQKICDIYAKLADQHGCIDTLEGTTHCLKRDYLVYENPEQTVGAYAVSAERFKDMYELVDDEK
jgi:hypothetical protein